NGKKCGKYNSHIQKRIILFRILDDDSTDNEKPKNNNTNIEQIKQKSIHKCFKIIAVYYAYIPHLHIGFRNVHDQAVNQDEKPTENINRRVILNSNCQILTSEIGN